MYATILLNKNMVYTEEEGSVKREKGIIGKRFLILWSSTLDLFQLLYKK